MKMNRSWIFASIIMAAANVGWAAKPAGGSLGGGVVVGDPFGPTAKYWMSSTRAIDIGIGFQSDVVVYADYLWQGWERGKTLGTGNLGGYLGLGPRFQDIDHGDNTFGIRTVAGVNYFFDRFPIEVFGELAPVFQLSPDTDTDFDAGIGVRVYFGR